MPFLASRLGKGSRKKGIIFSIPSGWLGQNTAPLTYDLVRDTGHDVGSNSQKLIIHNSLKMVQTVFFLVLGSKSILSNDMSA